VFVDPAVSRAKFQREVDEFKAQQRTYHRRGVWLLDDTFPEVFLALMALKTPPFAAAALFGVLINFDNFDIEPPSIKFVHPITRQPLRAMDLPHPLPRVKRVKGPDGEPATGANGEPLVEQQPLLQADDIQRPGFICLQGVREYHAHPAHTGDSWWLYRGTGVGRLAYLVNILATYAIDPVEGLNFQVKFNGYTLSPRLE
jgi:hypothetical protein